MKIAFFSESNFEGKIKRDFSNMRTEYAWYVALDAVHHPIYKLNDVKEEYDLGIVIIPKKNIEIISKLPIIEEMRRVCKKIGFMQEGPHWYFQDYPIEHQIWYYNILSQMDFILAHNKSDIKYYKGLLGNKHVYQNKSLMILDELNPRCAPNRRAGVIIGGNMCRWYGGFDSYIIAQEFGTEIFAPSMGRKIEREEEMDITHLPYMSWKKWVNNLAHYKYAVHLMPTHAAGTFSLNCAWYGIPCIGYKDSDTQSELHPLLTVDNGDLDSASKLAKKLKNDEDFYTHCSAQTKLIYKNSGFVENKYIYNMNKIFKEVMNETN